MKKILSLMVVFALIFEGIFASCISAFAVSEDSILSISAEDTTVREGLDCEDVGFPFYAVSPTITVRYTEDGEEKSFTGLVWEVENELGVSVAIFDDQSSENTWQAGETHTCSVCCGSQSSDFSVTVVENPVSYFEIVETPKTVYKNTGGFWTRDSEWDDDSNTWVESEEYYMYYIDDGLVIEAFMKDGTTYKGAAYEIASLLDVNLYYVAIQGYKNPWGVGSHEVALLIGNTELKYDFNIVESNVSAVTVVSVDSLTENIDGGWCTSRVYNEETGEYDSEVEWFWYNHPEATFKIDFNDGTPSITVTESALSESELMYDISDTQDYDSLWSVGGKNTVYCNINGFDFSYDVVINEMLYASIELLSGGVTCTEYTNGLFVREYPWDEETGTNTETPPYFLYEDPHDCVFRLNMKDGTFFDGTAEELAEEYDVFTFFSSDQSYENQWGVGDHSFTFGFGTLSVEVPFTVTATKIKNVRVTSSTQKIYENTGGVYMSSNNPGGEEWYRYAYSYPTVEVTFEDGSKESGVAFYFMHKYGLNVTDCDTQSEKTPWDIGVHVAKLYLGGYECTYTVEIIESPLVSLSVQDVNVVEYIDGHSIQNGVYNEETGTWVYSDSYFVYRVQPETVSAEFKDGSTFEGDFSAFQSKYNTTCSIQCEQSFDNPWGVGTHTATLETLGKKIEFNVNVLPCPIESITLIKEPDTKTVNEFEVYRPIGAVVRINRTDGTYKDVEFEDGGFIYIQDEVLNLKYTLVGENITNGDKHSFKIGLEGGRDFDSKYFVEWDVNVVSQVVTKVELSNKDGYLYLSTNVNGVEKSERITEIKLYGEVGLEYDETTEIATYHYAAYVYTENTAYDGYFICSNHINDEYYFDLRAVILGKTSNTLATCPWYNAVIKGRFVSIIGMMDSIVSTSDKTHCLDFTVIEDFNDEFTSENGDFLADFAAMVGRPYRYESVEYYSDGETNGILISLEDLEALIRSVFSFNSDEPFDFTGTEFYKTFDGSRVRVKVLSFGFEADTEYSLTPVKDGDSWKYVYDCTYETSEANGSDFSIDITASINETGKISEYKIDHTVTDFYVDFGNNFKDTYFLGEKLNTNKLQFVLEYSDGSKKTVPVTSDMISGFDSSKAQVCTVTVTYKGYKDTFTVNVEEEPEYTVGDVNADGNVNMKDILVLRKIVAGIQSADSTQEKSGDLDGNGSINMRDILLLRKAVAGIK